MAAWSVWISDSRLTIRVRDACEVVSLVPAGVSIVAGVPWVPAEFETHDSRSDLRLSRSERRRLTVLLSSISRCLADSTIFSSSRTRSLRPPDSEARFSSVSSLTLSSSTAFSRRASAIDFSRLSSVTREISSSCETKVMVSVFNF